MIARLVIVAAVLAAAGPARADESSERAIAALKAGGHYGLMRHAHAPGRGEPEDFRGGDCAAQRNLDAAGRVQAVRIGAGLRRAGITILKLYASRWCRGLETAELLAVGVRASTRVEPLDILNEFGKSLDSAAAAEREQTKHLAALVSQPIAGPSVLLVTHHDNIAALTSLMSREGEIVVVKPHGSGKFSIVGRIPPDALAEQIK